MGDEKCEGFGGCQDPPGKSTIFSDAKAASRFADLRVVDIVVGSDVGRHSRQEQLQLGQPAAVFRRGAGEEAQRDHEPGTVPCQFVSHMPVYTG